MSSLNPSLIEDLISKELDLVIAAQPLGSPESRALFLLKAALDNHVSDIHVEPHVQGRFLLRHRIDGYLHDVRLADGVVWDLDAVLFIKKLAKLPPSDSRVPQHGFFYLQNNGRSVRIDVSTILLMSGEKMVIHLIPGKLEALNLRLLGLTAEQSLIVEEKLQSSYGMIFVTGPGQSGVTSTVYSILKRRMSAKVNILTIEDPVEQLIHGINQVQVCADIGLTCAAGLRAFLRQDPDVIYSGSEPDEEVFGLCVRAALTGRLVMNSFFALDVSSALLRVLEMGRQIPHLLAEGLTLIVSQRLIRRLCVNCKQPHDLSASEKRDFGITAKMIYRAKPSGCEACRGTGYWGRTGIFEVLPFEESLRSAIRHRLPDADLRKTIEAETRMTLYQAGISKVNEGIASIEEVLRVQF